MTEREFWLLTSADDYRTIYLPDGSGFDGTVTWFPDDPSEVFYLSADFVFDGVGGQRWPSEFHGTICYEQVRAVI